MDKAKKKELERIIREAEKKNRYMLPKGVTDLFDEYSSLIDLRDLCVKLPFGFRMAAKAAKKAEIARNDFWQRVYMVYPSLEGKTIEYKRYERVVAEKRE